MLTELILKNKIKMIVIIYITDWVKKRKTQT